MKIREGKIKPQMQINACCYGATKTIGAVAEWLRSGLQNRLHEFDSRRRLKVYSMCGRYYNFISKDELSYLSNNDLISQTGQGACIH